MVSQKVSFCSLKFSSQKIFYEFIKIGDGKKYKEKSESGWCSIEPSGWPYKSEKQQ